MKTKIQLSANGVFTVELLTAFPPPLNPTPFGWVYVVGETGSATVEVADGAPPSLPAHVIPAPGMLVAAVRHRGGVIPSVIVKAGAAGFTGEIDIEAQRLA